MPFALFNGMGFAMRKYDTILFDADDTLLDFRRSEREALRAALAGFGIAADDAIIADYSRINASLWRMLEQRKTDRQSLRVERFARLCEKYCFPVLPVELADVYAKKLSEQSFTTVDAEYVCSSLYLAGCRLYLITNGLKDIQTPRFSASGLSRYFSGVFISEDMGYEKPDKRFFRAATVHIPDFDIKRSIVIGDSQSSDIAGGIGFGTDVCWYNPEGKETEMTGITYTVTDLKDIIPIINGEVRFG